MFHNGVICKGRRQPTRGGNSGDIISGPERGPERSLPEPAGREGSLVGAMTFSQGQPAHSASSLTSIPSLPPSFQSGLCSHRANPTRSPRAWEALDVVHMGQPLEPQQAGEGETVG